ncbi:undecaprenyl-diphosphate phosphatase [soil metagenome]
MTYLDAIILGIVEGVTEFLPISSTGHLILAENLLGLTKSEMLDAFSIIIQLGAILAVLGLYRERVWAMCQGLLGKNPVALSLFLQLIVAFIPAAILGKLLHDKIEEKLMSAGPVVAALIIGGIVMIVVEIFIVKPRQREGASGLRDIEDLTFLDAILIGLVQCLAMWPGTSRSMATIVGGQLRGLSNRAAAEFSFLLALPTLGAATLYSLYKHRDSIKAMNEGYGLLAVGTFVAMIVAFFVMKWFVKIVTKGGMIPFAIYRIAVGILFLLLVYYGYVEVVH